MSKNEKLYQKIAKAKEKGETIASACARYGVPVTSFYGWQRKQKNNTDVVFHKTPSKPGPKPGSKKVKSAPKNRLAVVVGSREDVLEILKEL